MSLKALCGIKKRNIISIVITIAVIFFTNKYWLKFSSMPVDIDMEGKGKCSVEVQLNKKDDNKFKKTRSETKEINLNKSSNFNFQIHGAKFPKRIRLVLKDIQNEFPVTVKNVNLKNGEYVIKNFDNTEVVGAKVLNNNNELVLKPLNNIIYITFNNKLNLYSNINFDYKLFIIIVILTYLLAYKLSNYAADFNTIKGKSKTDLIFLIIFFIFLLIPMLHIDKSEMSYRENRMLAKLKPFITNQDEINFYFGRNFDKWFSDRFFLRDILIKIYNSLYFYFANMNDKGLYDKNTGFLYTLTEFDTYNINDLDKNYEELKKFNLFCNNHGIKLYVLIVPKKVEIYNTDKFYINKSSNHNKFMQYLKNKDSEGEVNIIYPYDELKNGAEKEFMFFKTEHHWTDDAAFIGYKALMNRIVKDFSDIHILNESDYNFSYNTLVRGDVFRTYDYGQSCSYINLIGMKKYHKTKYRYYTHKDFKNLHQTLTYIKYHFNKLYYYPKGSDYRVIQLGTSQNENLTEFIPFTFKNVKRLRNNTVIGIKQEDEFKIIKYYKDEILNYKPDIIIFCITYNNFLELHNLFNME